jgi:hypothetical protein
MRKIFWSCRKNKTHFIPSKNFLRVLRTFDAIRHKPAVGTNKILRFASVWTVSSAVHTRQPPTASSANCAQHRNVQFTVLDILKLNTTVECSNRHAVHSLMGGSVFLNQLHGLYSVGGMNRSLVDTWGRQTEVLGEKTCFTATLSNTHLTLTGLGTNQGLRTVRPATKRLSHGTDQLSIIYGSVYKRRSIILESHLTDLVQACADTAVCRWDCSCRRRCHPGDNHLAYFVGSSRNMRCKTGLVARRVCILNVCPQL